MKIHYLTYLLFSATTFTLYAQNAIESRINEVTPKLESIINSQLNLLQEKTTYFVVRIDIQPFQQSEVLVMLPDGTNELMYLKNVVQYNYRDYSIYGARGQASTYALTSVDGIISGEIRIKSKSWSVHPLNDSLQLLYPTSAIRYECKQTINNVGMGVFEELIDEIKRNIQRNKFVVDDCRVRLLVMYTTAVDDASNNGIMSTIRDRVEWFNQANENSEVNFEVELARVIRTSYIESGEGENDNHYLDLKRFRDTNDDYMDVVHDYRSAYDADMCILLVDLLPGATGQAWSIGASYANSFCIAKWSANTSFTHEFGHLLGCDHDPYSLSHNENCVDLGVPTGCNHGYVNISETNGFRTIMAYPLECNCENTECDREQHWSNPNVTFNGDPTGTECSDLGFARENDAQKLNDDFDIQGSHESYVANKTWNYVDPPELQDETIKAREFGDLLGEFTLDVAESSSTTFTIESDGEANFRAGDRITFYPGFSAKSGCIVKAILESCTDIKNLSKNSPAPEFDVHDEITGELISTSRQIDRNTKSIPETNFKNSFKE